MRLMFIAIFAPVLAVLALLSAVSAPAGAGSGIPVSAAMPQDERPTAEICLPPEAGDTTCAALFLDEDGYALCLREGPDGRIRCINETGSADAEDVMPDGEMPEAPPVILRAIRL